MSEKLRALTPEIIKSAFRKTGLWPFNQDVISKEDMAPSKETSCEGHLPATMAPEVAMLAKLMQDMSIAKQVSAAVATALAEGDESADADAVSSTSVTGQVEEPAAASSAMAMIGNVVGGSASAESYISGRFTNYNPDFNHQLILRHRSSSPISWHHPPPYSNIQILHLQDIKGKRNTSGFERE